MGEDCLVLNVLTPAVDSGDRPVMVYLHGGGFDTGSGAVHTLGDRFVSEQDVVLVTVNHRLNLSGFLYLGGISPEYAVGNPGVLDLIQALQWVRDNIANFGGDPSKVTIFGESGGGAKVSLLMGMPQAQGLFRAAIIQSAGPVDPAPAEGATAVARDLLRSKNINEDNLAALHDLPLSELIPAGAMGASNTGPTADGQTLPAILWGAGAPAISENIPLIVGYCRDEASLFFAFTGEQLELADFDAVAARLAPRARKTAAQIAPAVAAYRAAYPNETPDQIFMRMLSLAQLGWGSRVIADQKAQQPAAVYYYRMEYDTQIPPLGAFHTCELPLANRMVLQPRAENLSLQLAGAWAAFARSGDPNHSGMPRWDRYQSGSGGPIILFNEETTSGVDPELDAQNLWRSILGGPLSFGP